MRVLADGRVRRTPAEWRALVERFEQSGQSMTAFCRRAKLPRSSFVKWRRRVSKGARAAQAELSPAFVEWIAPRPAQPDAAQGGGDVAFELALPGGAVLRWKA